MDKDALLNATPIRGSNQVTVRGFNERLVLHLVRKCGTLTKAAATQATGLSPNAVSVIFNALEADKLLLRGEPIRGRVGQPSVPMRLNPAARHDIGFKIGRHSFDLVVVDFCGKVIARRSARHRYPTPTAMRAFVKENLRPTLRSAKLRREDIAAFGVAMPSELWHWTEDFDAPRDEMEVWERLDVAAELRPFVPGTISVENDGTCACRAELIFGPQPQPQDVIYFFIGTLIGGGIVLNGSVFKGRRGTSGGFGPLRIPDEPGGTRLIDHASLTILQRLVAEAGRDPDLLRPDAPDWQALEPMVTAWIGRTARSLAHAIVSTQAVIDFEAVVIDGAFPASIRGRIVDAVGQYLGKLDLQGVVRPAITPGHFGDVARALGAASFDISTNYMIDQNTLQRKDMPARTG